ncbi:MAG: hypothetical protein ACTHU0_16520, partial [Kofleriaceae bacterium]
MQLTYPGVYVTETPSSVRPVASVATSIGAFIDFFPEGPVGKAVRILGSADFERIFGGIDPRSDASYQIAQFFLNGGSSAWVVRAAPGAEVATARVLSKTTAGADALGVAAINAGAWGNRLRFVVEPVLDPATGTISTRVFNLYVSRYATPGDRRPPLATERYLNVSIEATSPRWYVDVVNASSQLVAVESLASPAILAAFNGTVGGAIDTTANFNTFNGEEIKVSISGLTGPAATVTCKLEGLGANKDLRALRAAVEAAIRAQGDKDPGYAGATVALVGNRFLVRPGARTPTYTPTETISIAPGGVADKLGFAAAVVSTNVQEYVVGATAATLAQAAGDAGTDGTMPMATDLIGDPVAKTGLHALDDVDLFNLLCLPRTVASDFTASG